MLSRDGKDELIVEAMIISNLVLVSLLLALLLILQEPQAVGRVLA